MLHRHLNHQRLTLAAIDDIIARGRWQDWVRMLSSAARLQHILPGAVLVRGTAAAVHAEHRFSRDADHVLTNLRAHFDQVLAQLESSPAWKTTRVQRPEQILGRLDGI